MMTTLIPNVMLSYQDWRDFYDVTQQLIPYSGERIDYLDKVNVGYIWTQVYTLDRGVEIYQGRFYKIESGNIEGYYIAGYLCEASECHNIVVPLKKTK